MRSAHLAQPETPKGKVDEHGNQEGRIHRRCGGTGTPRSRLERTLTKLVQGCAMSRRDSDARRSFGHITTTLAHRWYDEIESGRKRVEFREGKPYWDVRLLDHVVKTITFSRGYSSRRMTFEVKGIHRLAVTMDELFAGKPIREIPLSEIRSDSIYAIHLGRRLE